MFDQTIFYYSEMFYFSANLTVASNLPRFCLSAIRPESYFFYFSFSHFVFLYLVAFFAVISTSLFLFMSLWKNIHRTETSFSSVLKVLTYNIVVFMIWDTKQFFWSFSASIAAWLSMKTWILLVYYWFITWVNKSWISWISCMYTVLVLLVCKIF